MATQQFPFPDDPDLIVEPNVIPRDPITGKPTPASTYIAQYAGSAWTDPLVAPGQMSAHVHDFYGTVQANTFATPHILDAVDLASPYTVKSVCRHRGLVDGYQPIAYWPSVLNADAVPVDYKPDIAVYHVAWPKPPGPYVAPPSGTGYVIRNGINGSFQMRSDGGFNIFGPKFWSGEPRADDHSSHTSLKQTETCPIPIAQVQIYVTVRDTGPLYWQMGDGEMMSVVGPEAHADYVYAYRQPGFLQFIWDQSFNRSEPRKFEAVRARSTDPDGEPTVPPPEPTLEERVTELERWRVEHMEGHP